MGVPLVIINFSLGFSLINHPAIGHTHLWKFLNANYSITTIMLIL